MTNYKYKTNIIIVVFIAIISFPFINSKMNIINDIKSFENRRMASRPPFDIKHLDPYPSKFEKYYNDNFTFRSTMVKNYNLLNIELFKKSPVPDEVIIGNDGWLFMAGNENDSYRGRHRFVQSELESFRLELEYRKTYLSEIGCKFYFVIAPCKANIYTDKVSKNIYRFFKQSWGEQIIEYLNKTSDVKPINVYDTLRQKKDKELLYYKLDNHWNQLGAHYAANKILQRINIDFPEISNTNINDYRIKKTLTNSGNISNLISNIGNFTDYSFELIQKSKMLASDAPKIGYPIVNGFPYPWEYENEKEIKNSKKPKILIISDSFGGNIFPFLAEKFSRSVKIFDSWQYKLNEDIIKSEKPDIVLLIVLESNIRNLLNYQSRLSKAKK